MKISHSKLSTILNCPASYFLSYIQGISLKTPKPALEIGSAVHWGIEHNTNDLSEYFKEKGTFRQKENYNKEQVLPEAMVFGYLKHKDELFEKILTDTKTHKKLELLEETHELFLTAKIKSNLPNVDYHEFVGIIDLLLLTNKGFIIIDYKTSSIEPDWEQYLDQIYRYIMLLKNAFPDIPVYKIGIINIRKKRLQQKKTENEIQFLNRLKFEYEVNDENLVNYHEYLQEDLDKNLIDNYINNVTKMCDFAHNIDENKLFYINFSNAINVYGKSDFYDIFYKTPDAHVLYQIKDYIWNEEENEFMDIRDCTPLDMKVLDRNNCLNKYSIFKEEYLSHKNENLN